MPTPHGTRGGIAFSADEVRVLRSALTEVLSPLRGTPAAELPVPPAGRGAKVVAPRPAERLRDCRRLATALDAAVHEAGRLRVFLLEELRRTALPHPCDALADHDVRRRLEAHMPAPRRLPTPPGCLERPEPPARPDAPAPADEGERKPKPGPKPAPGPAAPKPPQKPQQKPQQPPAPEAPQQEPEPEPKAPEPAKEPEKGPEQPARRRTPTPAEIWPPRRRDHKPDQGRSARPEPGWLR